MKNYTLLILLAFSINAYSQNSQIIFEKKNSKIEIIGDTTTLTLPLTFRFKENDFKKIELKNPINNISLSGEQEFGVNAGIKTKTEQGFYEIQLKFLENKVQASIMDDNESVACPDNSIKVSLDGEQVTIRYKKSALHDEEDYVSGYIYYDAMALVSNKLKKRTKLEILKSYGYAGSSDNPFLKNVYDLNQSDEQVLLSPTTLLTNLGNTDVTNFAAGLARFLAERTKEELNEAFFNKMKEQLNTYPELTTVFPKTSLSLNIIETYSYASVIQVLKEAFETDIQNLPENLYNVKHLTATDCDENAICGKNLLGNDRKDCDNYKDCKARLASLEKFFTSPDGHWVALGMLSVREGFQSTNPAYFLKSIVSSTEFDTLKTASARLKLYNDYNIISSIELSNFISQSLMSKDDKQVWINSAELKSLITTKGAFEVYLGLLLSFEQRKEDKVVIKFYKSDTANGTITLGGVLLEAKNNYDFYKPQIVDLVKNSYAVYNTTNNAIKKMIAASDKSIEVEPQALYDYYRTLTSSLKPIANSPLLDSLIGKDLGTKFDKVEKFLTPSVDLAYHISTKKYSAAVYDASILLSSLDNIVGSKKNSVTKSFVKYGTLISTVATAQTSDEVKQALKASVLPVGNSAIKRKSAWSISLNGYVGGFYGKAHSTIQDTLRNSATNKLDTITKPVSYKTFGVYAPVGVSFNRGFKSGWGVSLTAQILDLGALVNFYLAEGDEASLPTDFKVKLSDILSPGVQLAFNVPKTPLTIMGGVQYVPALNSSSQISTGILSPIAWRGQIAIVVDIPFFNFKVWDFKK